MSLYNIEYNQSPFIKNFNLLLEGLKQENHALNMTPLNLSGICDGLVKMYILMAKEERHQEFFDYIAFINSLNLYDIKHLIELYQISNLINDFEKECSSIIHEFQEKFKENTLKKTILDENKKFFQKNKEIWVKSANGSVFTLEKLFDFVKGIDIAFKNQDSSTFKSIRANWENCITFICQKNNLAGFLKKNRILDKKGIIYATTGEHSFAIEINKENIFVYDPNNPQKPGPVHTIKKVAEEIINVFNRIKANNTPFSNISLCFNWLSYGNYNEEFEDILIKNKDTIEKNNYSKKLVSEYHKGNISRMETAILLLKKFNPLSEFGKELNNYIYKNQVVSMGTLLKNTKCINQKSNKIAPWLWLAIQNNQTDAAKQLIDAGADVNSHYLNYWPITLAAKNGNTEIIEYLIKNEADINVCTEDGLSPLYIATLWGHFDAVKLLIENKANMNIMSNHGKTALLIAHQCDHSETEKFLLENGVNMNACNKNGETLLFKAAQNNDIEAVKFLCEKGADINAFDKQGTSAILMAAHQGNFDIVKMLLEKGAELNEACNDTETLLTIAAKHNRTDIIQLLINKKTIADNSNRYHLSYLEPANMRFFEPALKEKTIDDAANSETINILSF